ncbi:hypothetical protein ACVI3U_002824 [Sinorhizobium medicae]
MPAQMNTAFEVRDGLRDFPGAVAFSAIDFGKRYNTRKGKVVGPLAFDAASQWPWIDPNSGDAWTAKGRFSQDIDSDGDAPDHPSDIVSECVDKMSTSSIPRLVPRMDAAEADRDFSEVCGEPLAVRDLTVSVCIGLGTIIADVRAAARTGEIVFIDNAEFRPHGGATTDVDANRLSSFAVLRGGSWVPVVDVLAARVREEVSA